MLYISSRALIATQVRGRYSMVQSQGRRQDIARHGECSTFSNIQLLSSIFKLKEFLKLLLLKSELRILNINKDCQTIYYVNGN